MCKSSERLRRKIEVKALSEDAATTVPATVSIGGTAYPSKYVGKEGQLLQ